MLKISELFVKGGYFTDVRDYAQAFTKIKAGQEMGIEPFSALNGIHIIKGKLSVGAGIQAAKVKASGKYDYRVLQKTAQICEIEFFENMPVGDGKVKRESLGVESFTLEEARKAGTQNLDKYAKNMLFARCITNGVKTHCPDVFSCAVYTPEELGADTDENGEIISAVVTSSASPVAPPDVATEKAVRAINKRAADFWGAEDAESELAAHLAKHYQVESLAELTQSQAKELYEALAPQPAAPVEAEVAETEPAPVEAPPAPAEEPAPETKGNPKWVTALVLSAQKTGLSMEDKDRVARLASFNRWLKKHFKVEKPIESFSDLKERDPDIARAARVAIERLELTWPGIVPAPAEESAPVEGEVVEDDGDVFEGDAQ